MNKERLTRIADMTGTQRGAFIVFSRQDLVNLLAHVEKLENDLKEALEAAEAEPPVDCCRPDSENDDFCCQW